MKIENQVCSLEQAKKLKEVLGEVYGLFVYMENKALESDSKIMLSTQTESFKQMGGIAGSAFIKYYPAFTVAELGVMLEMDDDKHFLEYHYNNHVGVYECVLSKRDERHSTGFAEINQEEGDTEAECRAEMLIYLLENKLTTPEEVNQILTH